MPGWPSNTVRTPTRTDRVLVMSDRIWAASGAKAEPPNGVIESWKQLTAAAAV